MKVKLARNKQIIDTEAYIWPCETCGRVHLRAGDMLLTFAQNDFTEFTEAVAECYCQSQTLQRLGRQLAQAGENVALLNSELTH